jgi:hypothetical protein
VFCSISEQFQRFQFLVGFGLVVALSSAGACRSRFGSVLPDFRTDSVFQGIIDVGLVVGVLLDL